MGRTQPRSPLWRPVVLLSVLSIVGTACGDDSTADQATTAPPTTAVPAPTSEPAPTTTSPPPTTSTTAAPATTTTEPVPEFEPAVVSYMYPSTGEIQYEMSIERKAEVTIEGGAPEEMPPGAIEMITTLGGAITYQTSPGSEENTTTIRIVSDFRLVENEMRLGGVTMPAPPDAEAPGFETPIDVTVVVDQQGNVLEVSSEVLDELFGGQSFLPNASVGSSELNRPFGPAFPDHPVDIGDTWTERSEQEGPEGMGTIVTTAEHHLVGVDEVGGRSVLVIESEYLTEAFEWDMSEFLQGMFGAFGDEPGEKEATEGADQMPEFGLSVSAGPSTVTAVTAFDPQEGLVLQGEYQAQGEVTSSMTLPGETGDPTAIVSSVVYEQTVTFTLRDPAA